MALGMENAGLSVPKPKFLARKVRCCVEQGEWSFRYSWRKMIPSLEKLRC